MNILKYIEDNKLMLEGSNIRRSVLAIYNGLDYSLRSHSVDVSSFHTALAEVMSVLPERYEEAILAVQCDYGEIGNYVFFICIVDDKVAVVSDSKIPGMQAPSYIYDGIRDDWEEGIRSLRNLIETKGYKKALSTYIDMPFYDSDLTPPPPQEKERGSLAKLFHYIFFGPNEPRTIEVQVPKNMHNIGVNVNNRLFGDTNDSANMDKFSFPLPSPKGRWIIKSSPKFKEDGLKYIVLKDLLRG